MSHANQPCLGGRLKNRAGSPDRPGNHRQRLDETVQLSSRFRNWVSSGQTDRVFTDLSLEYAGFGLSVPDRGARPDA